MSTSLRETAKEKGIRYFLISFTDLFGVVRSKLVPASAIAGMQKDGAGFAGFAAHLDMTPADADMFGLPDSERLIQLPWKPEVGWLPSDIYLGGEDKIRKHLSKYYKDDKWLSSGNWKRELLNTSHKGNISHDVLFDLVRKSPSKFMELKITLETLYPIK